MSDNEITTNPFSLAMWDYMLYSLHVFYRGLLRFPRGVFFLAIIIMVPLAFGYDDLASGDYMTFALWMVGSLIFWLGFIPLLSLTTTWRSLRKNAQAFSLRTAHLTPDHLILAGPTYDAKLTWLGFKRIEQSQSMVFLYHGNAAHLVPKSAFNTPEIAKRFYDLAKQHTANAKHKQVGAFYGAEGSIDYHDANSLSTRAYRISFGAFFIYYMQIMYAAFSRPFNIAVILLADFGMNSFFNRYELISGNWNQILISSLTTTLAVYILMPPAVSVLAWLVSRRSPAAKGERLFSLNREGIIATGATYTVNLSWASLSRLDKRFGQMVFYTGPYTGIVIPFSAFPDKAAAEAFYAQALAYFNAAKTPATKSALDEKT